MYFKNDTFPVMSEVTQEEPVLQRECTGWNDQKGFFQGGKKRLYDNYSSTNINRFLKE